MDTATQLPLQGIRVVEFSHMIMGPTCGMILADLGADVIKVEPLKGDNTRRMPGMGAGFYNACNRNKKSLAVDLDQPEGKELVMRLISQADVVCENFKPGKMKQVGLDYQTLAEKYPRLIYVSLKGFLPGPYENRTALDEVVQMMGGLAYMTGPPGRPLRAGASVNDIMGGTFGALGVVTALHERSHSGRGQEVQSALFENCVFLCATHMADFYGSGIPPNPMPARKHCWGVYDTFETADGEQIFLAVVSDAQWKSFCSAFDLHKYADDEQLKDNGLRVVAREWLIPEIRKLLMKFESQKLYELFERYELSYAPIVRPDQLFDDKHLNESGGLAPLIIEGGEEMLVPLLPLAFGGRRLQPRMPIAGIGENTPEILQQLGYSEADISMLRQKGAIRPDSGK